MKNFLRLSLVTLMLILFVNCSDDDSETSGSGGSGSNISNQVLSGIVFDEPFEAAGGKAWNDGEEINIAITNQNAGCESNIFDYEYEIGTWVPKKIGIHTTTIVFNKQGSTPMNFLNSEVEVVAVSDSEITIKLKQSGTSILSEEKHDVEGKFTIPICQ